MKAAVFYEAKKPLRIEEVEKPSLEAGEALIRVAACGVCGTDLHYYHGVPTFKKPPIILGHEASGIVEEIGKEVTEVSVGDRVLIPAVLSCGRCINCLTGRDNICENMIMVGNNIDGAYAEYIKVPARCLVKLPPELPLEESAIIADAITTPFHAVERAGITPGTTVAVFGCGGVGLNVIQIASVFGAMVYAIDIVEDKLKRAKELGAFEVINASVEDPVKRLRELTSRKGVDVAFEAIGNPDVMSQALGSVKWGGKMVVIGYSETKWTMDVPRVMYRELSVLGSLGCELSGYYKVIDLIKAGKISLHKAIDRKMPLEDINKALEALEKKEVIGRILIIPK